MTDGFYRVVLPYAVYGVEVRNGLIFDSAPIAKWSVRSTLDHFNEWVQGKGGVIERLDDV